MTSEARGNGKRGKGTVVPWSGKQQGLGAGVLLTSGLWYWDLSQEASNVDLYKKSGFFNAGN